MSLWENEESAQQQQTQRIIIVVGAIIAALIVIWVFRNAVTLASRPKNGVGFSSSGRARQVLGDMEREGSQPPSQLTTANPASPFTAAPRSAPPAARPYIAPPPPPVIAGAYAPKPYIVPSMPEMDPEERAQGKVATAPLRQTLIAVRDYDKKSFWSRPETENQDNTEEAANAVDALGAMVTLYGHPERFPSPMRRSAADAANGIRGYLQLTLDAAATTPEDRQRLRPSALKRLSDADAAVRKLEGANPNNGFTPGMSN